MAQEYCKVLLALSVCAKVISRHETSAVNFLRATGHAAHGIGVAAAIKKFGAPDQAIVAVGVEALAPVATQLIKAGVRRILLEKPGALDRTEIQSLNKVAQDCGTTVLLGYNRRFHAATLRAQELIELDGGPTSCSFEFTEWAHTINPLDIDKRVKQHWVMANSSHVIDLAFYLCGSPSSWSHYSAGQMDWHKRASRFCGSGVTERGILFSYLADWEAPGRWSVEVMTRRRRFIFKPLEKLQVMHLASVNTEWEDVDYALDERFKPGLYRQTDAFLKGNDSCFCTLAQQMANFDMYYRMAGYQ
jgi:predicted dehydrogenase